MDEDQGQVSTPATESLQKRCIIGFGVDSCRPAFGSDTSAYSTFHDMPDQAGDVRFSQKRTFSRNVLMTELQFLSFSIF
jgi:hypothetical protein